jgi:hypothetical protein
MELRMPDIPWTDRGELEPGRDYTVMASYLPLTRIPSTVRFFRGVSTIRKQLAGAEGLVGYTLRARPLVRDYWTLSVWSDQAALRGFMRTAPHVELMRSLRTSMGRTKFIQWEITAPTDWPSWTEALERLARG